MLCDASYKMVRGRNQGRLSAAQRAVRAVRRLRRMQRMRRLTGAANRYRVAARTGTYSQGRGVYGTPPRRYRPAGRTPYRARTRLY